MSDTGPREAERTLVERLRDQAAHHFHEWADDCLEERAATEITSLRHQVEALTADRSAAIDQGNFWRNYAKDCERRLAEVRAEERETCAKIGESWSRHQELLLRCGEMTAQELRTAVAVANGITSAIRNQGASNG